MEQTTQYFVKQLGSKDIKGRFTPSIQGMCVLEDSSNLIVLFNKPSKQTLTSTSSFDDEPCHTNNGQIKFER